MDDLLSEFLTETAESLDVVDVELVKFESDPQNTDVLDKVFRLVHTIKGTCGFLGLPRLEAVAHASETMLGKFRDGELEVTPTAVTLILESLDHIKVLLRELELNEVEPEGSDEELIGRLERAARGEAPDSNDQPNIGVDQAAIGSSAPETADVTEAIAAGISEPVPEPAAAEPAAPAPASTAVAAAAEAEAVEGQQKTRETSIANQSIRVNVEVLENLMTMVSELVLTRNQLLEMVRHLEDSEFKVPLQRLSNVTGELQEEVMKTRMQPIGNAWQKLPRIVRDLSQELSKKIELKMIGADTELDRQVLELIKDPLTHMVRNSADHGLETPEVRRNAGKHDVGTVTLRAYHEGGHIIIEVGDDGRGLDFEKIKAKALANGLASEAALEGMSETQIQKFIFHAGFSTAAAVTNVSGRGVGMDVVRSNIELIGGTIDLKSTLGKGTVFTIKIPLTLAIVSALIVEASGQRFAVPQLSVVELVRTSANSEFRIERINDTPVLRLRDRLLPLLFLDRELDIGEARSKTELPVEAFVIVTQVGATIFGIVVDGVFDTEEIVVKPVASVLRDITMFSGNTILGDGSVIMIIDPNGIAQRVSDEELGAQDSESEMSRANISDNESVTMLIFRAGTPEPKAVPLSLVTRLEEIEAGKIERANGQNLVQYRGRLMPVIHVNQGQPLKTEGRQPILVFTDKDRSMGLAVDEIVDIVEDRLDIELKADYPGMLGSAVIKGKATEVLDIGNFLTQVYPDWFERAEMSGEYQQERRILLVDDSAFFRNLITPLLKVAGYSVTTAESVEDAWRFKDVGVIFDVIVSDIEMPGTDGFEFASQIRHDDVWNSTPLIAISAIDDDRFRARGQEVGFNNYVSKSDRQALIRALDQVVSIKGEAA